MVVVDKGGMKRSYRLIGMLLSLINDSTNETIQALEEYNNLLRCHKNNDGTPAGVETIKFDDFDSTCVFDHFLAMLHGGLVFEHKWDEHGENNVIMKKTTVRLTTKGYDLLDEYKKWTS